MDRQHELDNLRALAMLAGVVFHAALAHSTLLQPIFPTADRSHSLWVDALVWFPHLFRMPLFFAIAGVLTASLVARRGLAGMMRNRFLRIAVPFLLFWPLMHLTMQALTLHAASTAEHPGALLRIIRGLLESAQGLPQMLPGTGHLWFLYYLLFFYILVWVGRTLGFGFVLQHVRAGSPQTVLLVFPLMLVPALAAVSAPHPAPEFLFPQFWAFGFYGAFFAFGYAMSGVDAWLESYRRFTLWLLIGSLLLYGAWLLRVISDPQAAGAGAGWLLGLVEACISVWMTLVCLDFGRRFLARGNRLLRYLAAVSYWTYLVHLPILFAIQYAMLDLDWPGPAKFALALGSTVVLCLLSERLLVQTTVLARVLGSARSIRSARSTVAT